MTSTDIQVDLIVNRLTRAQYNALSSQGKVYNTQLYVITDDKTPAEIESECLLKAQAAAQTVSLNGKNLTFDLGEGNSLVMHAEDGNYLELKGGTNGLDFNDGSFNQFYGGGGIRVDSLSCIQFGGDYYGEAGTQNLSAYLDGRYVRTVNNQAPDANGNVNVKGADGGLDESDLSDYAKLSALTNTYVDGVKRDLSVVHISESAYKGLVSAGSTKPNVLYITSADVEDMYGERIVNVGTPTDPADAATKGYADSLVSGVRNDMKGYLPLSGATTTRDLTLRSGSNGNSVAWNSSAGTVTLNNGWQQLKTPAQTLPQYISAEIKPIKDDVAYLSGQVEKIQYKLVTADLVQSGSYLTCKIDDHTVTTVHLTATTPVQIYLPAPDTDGLARDFILRLEVTSRTSPAVQFIPADGEQIDYEAEDETWAEIDPGTSIISFTETRTANG